MDKVEKWIRSTVGQASDREIAKLANLGQSTLSRQRRDGSVTVDTVVAIARTYQVSVIPALIALGIVTESDISSFSAQSRLEDASDEEIADEVLRRMKNGSKLMEDPISSVEDHLESRRSIRQIRPELEVIEEAERYVAKRKRPEPGEGDDDYGDGA